MAKIDFLRGKIAECIVAEMFSDMGYQVVRFGYENIMPGLANKDNLLKGRVSDAIRSLPDFIVVDKANNYAYYLEVKYRGNNHFKLDSDYKLDDVFIVLVSPNSITIQMVKNIKEEKPFVFLTRCSYFKNINKKIVCEYVDLLKQFF